MEKMSLIYTDDQKELIEMVRNMALKKLTNLFPDGLLGVIGEKLVTCELPEGECRLLRERMLFVHDDDQRLLEDRHKKEFRFILHRRAEAYVPYAALDRLNNGVRLLLMYAELDVSALLGDEGADHHRQIVALNRRDAANVHSSAESARVLLGNRNAALEKLKGAAYILIELLSILGEVNIPAALFEKRDAKLRLERGYRAAEAGLSDVELLGRLGVVLKFGKFAEVIEL